MLAIVRVPQTGVRGSGNERNPEEVRVPPRSNRAHIRDRKIPPGGKKKFLQVAKKKFLQVAKNQKKSEAGGSRQQKAGTAAGREQQRSRRVRGFSPFQVFRRAVEGEEGSKGQRSRSSEAQSEAAEQVAGDSSTVQQSERAAE
jgi:hypothetical protein